MIKIVTTEEITLTTLETNSFGDVIETQLPEGTEVTIWLDDPDAIGKDSDLTWRTSLFMWVGNYTERYTKPSIKLKEVSNKYDIKLFSDELYTPKFQFEPSDKSYVFSMIDNQNRLLVSFLYANGIFPEGSLEIVGINDYI
jgi:hypothetical protein